MLADFCTLLVELERPELIGWQRRAVLAVLEQIAGTGLVTLVDWIRFRLARDRVHRLLSHQGA